MASLNPDRAAFQVNLTHCTSDIPLLVTTALATG
jgi:hypothetical protein